MNLRVTFDFTLNGDGDRPDPDDVAERLFNHLCADEYDEIPELFSVDGYDVVRQP